MSSKVPKTSRTTCVVRVLDTMRPFIIEAAGCWMVFSCGDASSLERERASRDLKHVFGQHCSKTMRLNLCNVSLTHQPHDFTIVTLQTCLFSQQV